MNDIELIGAILVVVLVGVLAVVGGYVLGCFKTRRATPGAAVFNDAVKNGTTPILDVFGDSFAQWVSGKKEVNGSVIINHDTDTETIDQTVIDRAPSLLIDGIRSLIRVRMSAATMPLGPSGEVQLVCNHIDQPGIYPTLHQLGLYDHEWFFALRNDLPVVKEMIAAKCYIEVEKEDEKDKTKKVKVKEIDHKLYDPAIQELEAYRAAVPYVPKHDVFVDVPRVVNTTQLAFAPHVFKNITAIITAIITAQFERRYQNMKASPIWYYPACVLGGFISAVVCFKVLGL
jgi:hypothetical protein